MGRSRVGGCMVIGIAAAVALLPIFAGQAVAAPRLPASENPGTTFDGRFCDYADIPQGYGAINRAGERRVYQTAYRETDERGVEQAVLYVHENDASWLQKESGSFHKGRLLGEVVIGCGTGGP